MQDGLLNRTLACVFYMFGDRMQETTDEARHDNSVPGPSVRPRSGSAGSLQRITTFLKALFCCFDFEYTTYKTQISAITTVFLL